MKGLQKRYSVSPAIREVRPAASIGLVASTAQSPPATSLLKVREEKARLPRFSKRFVDAIPLSWLRCNVFRSVPLRRTAIRSGLEALYFSGVHRLWDGLWGGVGAILTLHHVRPARGDAFQPNRFLEVPPQFLDDALARLRRRAP